MRAAFIEETGPPEVIKVEDLPTPEPGPGQVLVKVRAASLNPIDLYIRSGMVAMPLKFPYVIGSDVAGIVDKVGPGCSRYKVGDRVWGSNQGLLGRQGVVAEYATIDEAFLYPTPALLPDVDAAAMALVGITAHLGLFHFGHLGKGELVYIPGGSGGVGSMVIQMAKAAGARVATSAGSAESIALCERLGADLAMNYKTDDIPAKLREFSPEGVDLWYETLRDPNLEISIPLLRKHGRMIVIAGRAAKPVLPFGAFYPRNCSIHGFAMFNSPPDDQRKAGLEMVRWIEEGLLKSIVGREFPLLSAVDAVKFLEAKTIHGVGTLNGKVVITIE
jgi:NADPH2:quinone reductase